MFFIDTVSRLRNVPNFFFFVPKFEQLRGRNWPQHNHWGRGARTRGWLDMAQDMAALAAYVKGPDSGFQSKADGTVLLHATHSNLKASFIELRLSLHMTVGGLKDKMMTHCGTSPQFMRLQLRDWDNNPVCEMAEEHRPLGYYSPQDGYVVHVIDTDEFSKSRGGWLENTNLVKKFELTDEQYAARGNTYKSWKAAKLKEDPTWTLEGEIKRRKDPNWRPNPIVEDDEHMASEAAACKVGDRCEAMGGRRGEVAFVGKIPDKAPGWWIGVKFDEPVGKNDGSVNGNKFFKCLPNYGAFMRPDKVQVGDFPSLDDEFNFSESEDEL